MIARSTSTRRMPPAPLRCSIGYTALRRRAGSDSTSVLLFFPAGPMLRIGCREPGKERWTSIGWAPGHPTHFLPLPLHGLHTPASTWVPSVQGRVPDVPPDWRCVCLLKRGGAPRISTAIATRAFLLPARSPANPGLTAAAPACAHWHAGYRSSHLGGSESVALCVVAYTSTDQVRPRRNRILIRIRTMNKETRVRDADEEPARIGPREAHD